MIEADPPASQRELVARLTARGVEADQSTVSRDLREMGAVRLPGDGGGTVYGFPGEGYAPHGEEELRRGTRDYVTGAEASGNMVILRTAPGAFPGAVDAANLFAASAQAAGIPLQIKLEPDDGYWSNVWNVEPFCASYWGGRPVQDQMYSTAYLSTAEWNDTKFRNAEFDALLLAARGELDEAKRKAEYSKMARILRDEGGLICPMFNDFVDGIRSEVAGWSEDPNGELMNGRALVKCWLA
jgi:peptide/nickel transport system substrate-binding protein